MMRRFKQQGFSLLIVLAAVLVATAIGLAGWYVFGNKDSSSNQSAVTTPDTNTTEPIDDNQEEQPEIEEEKYLVISEWGVRIPLGNTAYSNSVSYTYSVKNDTPYGGEVTSVQFEVPEKSPLYSCINIALDREAVAYREDSVLKGFPEVAELDGYIYYERRGESWCDVENAERTQTAETIMDELETKMRFIEKVD